MLFPSFIIASSFFWFIHYVCALKTTTISPKPFADPSPNVVSSNVLEMTRSNVSTRSSKALQTLRSTRTNYGNTPLTALEEGQSFSVSIGIGSQTFDVIMDTGSSDTWVPASNFECIDLFFGTPVDQSECNFGASLYSIDSTFSEIADENFNITYGDGEFASGCMGYESVTLAGITVTGQEFALVNLAAWVGDGFTSGLVGLAYPNLTSAFAGSDPTADNYSDPLSYNPIFTTMYQQQLVAPLFSIAINRGSAQGPSGYLALGGLPPVEFTEVFASSPIQIFSVEGEDLPDVLTFYTITPDGFVYGNGSSRTHSAASKHGPLMRPSTPTAKERIQVVVDSGTTLIYLPDALATTINDLFNPPASFNIFVGAYVVACNATAPHFGVQINGTTFHINPLDLILDDGSGTDTCISGINTAAFSGVNILGDVFFKNAVVIFDVGAGEMRFAAREHY